MRRRGGKKKPTDLIDLSAALTHSLLEEEGLLQSHKRRMRPAGLLRTLKGHEKKQK
jgi:hypothetical protein